jgi:thiol-disulfide isomerase/thioredoxin
MLEMMRFFFALLMFFSAALSSGFAAQEAEGHQIRVKLNNYDQPELYLGYYYGNKQYLLDTAFVDQQGFFTFSGKEPLKGGVYLIVMPPNNNFFQLLVTAKEQRFSVEAHAETPSKGIRFDKAPDNAVFYQYLNFLDEMKPQADRLGEEMELAGQDEQKMKAVEDKRAALDQQVRAFQNKIIKDHPASLTAAIIRANLPLDVPEFEGSEEEKQLQRWRYSQRHYFDNIDLADERLLRTPFLFQRVDQYVHKLNVQHPDTISKAIGEVLERMKPAEESFKYYLIHFLNEYARSNIVGMDAVYVYLVNKYYATGLAPWTDEEQLEKIIENAKALEPLLIGKTAPNLLLQTRDGKPVQLHEVQADYTVLYFWRHDCGHCKKSTPYLKEFQEKYKDRGVRLVAVCSKFGDEVGECWKYVDENGTHDWLQLVDPYHRSRFMTVYNIKTTPQLYILGADKEIISKRIGAEQLEEVMDKIIEMRGALK